MPSENTISFFSEIRSLVGSGEDVLAIERLVSFLKGGNREFYQESVVQQANLKTLQTQERVGLISSADAAVQRARIRYGILQFTDDIEKRLDRSLLPIPSRSVDVLAPESGTLEKIIGATSHLKSISWLRTGLERTRSVCRVVTPKGLGTGFLVADSHVMTNNHVIESKDVAARCFIEFGYEETETGVVGVVSRYRLDPDTFFQSNKALDYSVISISEEGQSIPLANWGTLTPLVGAMPEIGEHVSIIQHPEGGLKQVAVTANQVVNIYGNLLQYTTDTLPGSSGSPVFNDAWQVVALHHAGGNLVRNARGDRLYANEGISITAILEDLRR